MKHVEHFDLPRILKQQAESLLALASKLSDQGESLNGNEKALVRSALAPLVRESMEIIQGAYVTGSQDWLDSEMGRLKGLFDLDV